MVKHQRILECCGLRQHKGLVSLVLLLPLTQLIVEVMSPTSETSITFDQNKFCSDHMSQQNVRLNTSLDQSEIKQQIGTLVPRDISEISSARFSGCFNSH